MNGTGSANHTGRPLWQRALLILAALGFALGIYLSIRAQPELISDLDYQPLLVLALFAIPVTVLLNAEEFRLSAHLVGQDFPRAAAAEVTIVASVANMLPIPGGTMVRIAALKSKGAGLRDGTSATLLISFLWVAIAFLYSGAWLLSPAVSAAQWLGIGFMIFGAGMLFLVVVLGVRMFRQQRTLALLGLVKCGLVLLDASRIYLCFLVIGAGGSFGQASVLAVSSVVGASVSIVPAGLGVREGAAALLAPWIALAAASGYLATSLNRLVGLTIMAPVALYLGLRAKK